MTLLGSVPILQASGLDASIWSNRLHFTLDLYSKKTDNILYNVPVTSLTGVTHIYRNIGKMANKGIEVAIGGDIIRQQGPHLEP